MKLDMFLKSCYFKKSEKSECKKSSKNILDVWLYEQDGEATLENATTDEVA